MGGNGFDAGGDLEHPSAIGRAGIEGLVYNGEKAVAEAGGSQC